MQIKLGFLGGARNVTGSQYLLENNDTRVLVDCGLYQEREFKHRNWEPFPTTPHTLNAVLLTHAHLDHCGLLPKLVREGFRGKIYCTAATAEIVRIMLLDSAKIQQEDAEFKSRRHQREGRSGPFPEVPLYSVADVADTIPLLSPVKYGNPVHIADGFDATFFDAGHVIGSAMIKVTANQDGEKRTILFSGDVGRQDKPIIEDPTLFNEADYVLIESTYGDRLHESSENICDSLAEIVNSTRKTRGNIVIPSFSLERAQEVMWYLNELLLADRIPHLMVFVDSPMAVSITEVFKNHPEVFDEDMNKLMRKNHSPFDFPGLKMVRTVEESKGINHIAGTAIIIAGSGMCTGGRVKPHLVANISRKESTILFVGYQAIGTLGRHIMEGAKKIRILGQQYPVRARIAQIHGFSAHADRDELFKWISGLKKAPRHVFITHGEAKSAISFGEFLHKKTGWEVSVPEYGEEAILE